MATIDEIKIGNETRKIVIDADKVNYTNLSMEGVSDVEGALDYLAANGSGNSGGGGAKFFNPLLPWKKSKLRILCIGNSYMQGSQACLPAIMQAAGLTLNDIQIDWDYQQMTRLGFWLDKLRNNEAGLTHMYLSSSNGNLKWSGDSGNNSTGLRDRISGTSWDVIMLQEYPVSGGQGTTGYNDVADVYSSYRSYLTEFVTAIKQYCPNKKVTIVWHMIWHNSYDMSTSDAGWRNICNAVKEMVADTGIDVVIPTGTAIRNACYTNTFNGNNHACLVRDGVGHLAYGVAEYIAACAVFETMVAPNWGMTVLGNSAIPTISQSSNPSGNYAGSEIAVTAENKELCQRCAIAACKDWYHVDATIDPIEAQQ